MAKIALIGASGRAGSCLLRELSDRGHSVTAIARDPDRITALPHVTPQRGDLRDSDGLVARISGHDAVISSVPFSASDPQALIDALRASGVPRYLVVGGAGSLLVAPGLRLLDAPDFPAAYRPEARAGAAFLDLLRAQTDLDWTFLSPSAAFVAGQRTGIFRLGGDQLLTGDAGSSISFADFAIAMVDEVETPRHRRQRFTVGY